MKIAIIGSGGREHALVWKASQSPLASQIYAIPGNAGTAMEALCENVPIAADAVDQIVEFCTAQAIGLCIIGPEAPLVLGLADALSAKDIACFGPQQAAARLEGSKAFTKAFLERHAIPTADYAHFSDVKAAKRYVEKIGVPLVIKADGLAAGKGVIIAQTRAVAFAALEDMLTHHQFGDASASVVIEAFLVGEEASFICMADGENVVALATSQDHKAAYDGDAGPNTGGMGAYSPAPVVDQAVHKAIMDTIIHPTLAGLQQEDMPYVGFLYAGVMIDAAGKPKVLEFNCRLGDPETQPIMMRLESDLVAHCLAAAKGELATQKLVWRKQFALGVVLAAAGYPGGYDKGQIIDIDASQVEPGAKLFYAGVDANDSGITTTGGRVMCACALGDSIKQAKSKAYALAGAVSWDGMWHRSDIGYRAIAREEH